MPSRVPFLTMLESAFVMRFEEQLARARRAHPEREPPTPRWVELALTGARAQRFLVDVKTGEVRPRGQVGSSLTISMPTPEFEQLVARGFGEWLKAYDRGVVHVEGDPAKVEALQVYIERVLRRALDQDEEPPWVPRRPKVPDAGFSYVSRQRR